MVTLQLSSCAKVNRAPSKKTMSNILRMAIFYNSINDVTGYFFFGLERKFLGLVPSVNQRDFIGIVAKTSPIVIQRVQHNEIKILRSDFLFCVGRFIFGLQGK